MDDSAGTMRQTASQQNMLELRRQVGRQLAVVAAAHSGDGHTFAFQAPVTHGLPAGAYVRIRTEGGVAYLGQVTARTIAERDGPELSVDGDGGLTGDLGPFRIARASMRVPLRYVEGSGVLLCRLAADSTPPTTATDLFENAEIDVARAIDVDRYLASRIGERTALEIGTVEAGEGNAPARLIASGFDRHTFLCGQSGSGKTYALGVVLERLLLDTDLRLIVIDPNSDFVHLSEPRPFAEATRGFGDALTPDAYAALCERYRQATRRLRVLRPAPRGAASADALRVRFSDLAPGVQGMVLRIDPLEDREEYHALRMTIDRLERDRYSLADIQAAATASLSEDSLRLARRIANLGVARWDVWAEADEPSIADDGDMGGDARGLVLDTGGFGDTAEKSLIATATLGALWRWREQRHPVLIVIDEAHNVCAAEPADLLQAAATERAIRIAGEGRKFGLYLLLSTQRPQKIHPNVLSQCDNIILMRMNSAADIAELSRTFSFVPASLMERASAFTQGESLVAGKIAPSPLSLRFGGRISREGGSDVPTSWARRSPSADT